MNYKTGDILFVNKRTLWGSIVGWFQGDRFHHVGIIIKSYGKTYVFEAIAVGMAFTPIEEYIYKHHNKNYELLIKRHIENGFDSVKEKDILHFCMDLTDRPYEFLNLIGFQAVRMLFIKIFGINLWIGRSQKKSKRSLICSELVGLICNKFLGLFKKNWHKLAPSTIINHTKFQTILHLK